MTSSQSSENFVQLNGLYALNRAIPFISRPIILTKKRLLESIANHPIKKHPSNSAPFNFILVRA